MTNKTMPDEKSIEKVARQVREAISDRLVEMAETFSYRQESPIETLLITALYAQRAVSCRSFSHILWVDPKFPLEIENCPAPSRFGWPLFVETQKVVEGVRVDFLITTHVLDCDSGQPVGFARLIVECDGHNFHDRTKHQAARDRSRDRLFQEQGYTVFRFAGSEIYYGAWECAFQILNWAESKAWK